MDRNVDGYEFAHGREILYGDDGFFGLKIFLKLKRKLTVDDENALYRIADQIRLVIETNTAKLDPEGPATRSKYRAEIEDIYRKAGVPAVYMEELPNGYCHLPCCLNRPWFKVTSPIGHITIGWRKRVMSIDWKETRVKKSGEELFPDDKVTRWETGIHAWSVEDAVNYIKKLHEVA